MRERRGPASGRGRGLSGVGRARSGRRAGLWFCNLPTEPWHGASSRRGVVTSGRGWMADVPWRGRTPLRQPPPGPVESSPRPSVCWGLPGSVRGRAVLTIGGPRAWGAIVRFQGPPWGPLAGGHFLGFRALLFGGRTVCGGSTAGSLCTGKAVGTAGPEALAEAQNRATGAGTRGAVSARRSVRPRQVPWSPSEPTVVSGPKVSWTPRPAFPNRPSWVGAQASGKERRPAQKPLSLSRPQLEARCMRPEDMPGPLEQQAVGSGSGAGWGLSRASSPGENT